MLSTTMSEADGGSAGLRVAQPCLGDLPQVVKEVASLGVLHKSTEMQRCRADPQQVTVLPCDASMAPSETLEGAHSVV